MLSGLFDDSRKRAQKSQEFEQKWLGKKPLPPNKKKQAKGPVVIPGMMFTEPKVVAQERPLDRATKTKRVIEDDSNSPEALMYKWDLENLGYATFGKPLDDPELQAIRTEARNKAIRDSQIAQAKGFRPAVTAEDVARTSQTNRKAFNQAASFLNEGSAMGLAKGEQDAASTVGQIRRESAQQFAQTAGEAIGGVLGKATPLGVLGELFGNETARDLGAAPAKLAAKAALGLPLQAPQLGENPGASAKELETSVRETLMGPGGEWSLQGGFTWDNFLMDPKISAGQKAEAVLGAIANVAGAVVGVKGLASPLSRAKNATLTSGGMDAALGAQVDRAQFMPAPEANYDAGITPRLVDLAESRQFKFTPTREPDYERGTTPRLVDIAASNRRKLDAQLDRTRGLLEEVNNVLAEASGVMGDKQSRRAAARSGRKLMSFSEFQRMKALKQELEGYISRGEPHPGVVKEMEDARLASQAEVQTRIKALEEFEPVVQQIEKDAPEVRAAFETALNDLQAQADAQVVPAPEAPKPNSKKTVKQEALAEAIAETGPVVLEEAVPPAPRVTDSSRVAPPPLNPSEIPNSSVDAPDAITVAKESTNDIRESFGLDPSEATPEKITQWVEEAKNIRKAPAAIAQEVIDSPRVMSKSEQLYLGERIKQIIDSGDMSPDAVAEIGSLTEALRVAGSEWGRGGVARQLLIRANYEGVALKARAVAASGKELTAKQNAQIEAQAAKIQELTKKLQDAENAAVVRRSSSPPARNRLAQIRQTRADALATLRESAGKAVVETIQAPIMSLMGAGGGGGGSFRYTAETFSALKTIARTYVEEGIVRIDDLVLKLKGDVAGLGLPLEDIDYATASREALGEYARIVNQGRKAFGDDIQTAGNWAIQSKEVRQLRLELDTAKAKADALIVRLKPKTLARRVDSFATGSALANPVARIIDLAANTAKLTVNIATSPLRSGVSALVDPVAGTKGLARQGSLWNSKKWARALDGSGIRVKEALKQAWNGGDLDSLAKYGSGNIITRITGMTDIPFKEFYTRMALDDLAWAEARSRTKVKAEQAKIARQLLENPTDEMALIAEDWALRNTFNVDNIVSSAILGMKESAARQAKKQWGEGGADTVRLAVNMVTRFSKVIGNVALERLNYVPEFGLGEAALRLGKRLNRKAGPLSVEETRLITDLATKGLTGIALTTAGAMLYENGTFSPEIKKTKNGTIYADWGAWEQLGSAISPMMYGATLAAADDLVKQGLITPAQRDQFVWRTNTGVFVNQPAFSTPQAGFESLRTREGWNEFMGRMVSSNTIPGGVRVAASAMDPKEGQPWWLAAIESGRDVDSKGFWDEFKKRIPIQRNTLPSKTTKTLKKRAPNPVSGK